MLEYTLTFMRAYCTHIDPSMEPQVKALVETAFLAGLALGEAKQPIPLDKLMSQLMGIS